MGENSNGKGGDLTDAWSKWDKRIRDTILFLVGVLGIINELAIVSEPRPSVLVFLASLVGLPLIFAKDEQRRKRDQD